MKHPNIRLWVQSAAAFVIIFTPIAKAEVPIPEGPLDLIFIFRFVLAALMGVLIWVAKGTDTRLRSIERRIAELNDVSIRRHATLEHNTNRIMAIEHEQKQQASLISMQRELLLTKYLDKEETERHRTRVEETLAKQAETLISICHRLDNMARPAHRASDGS